MADFDQRDFVQATIQEVLERVEQEDISVCEGPSSAARQPADAYTSHAEADEGRRCSTSAGRAGPSRGLSASGSAAHASPGGGLDPSLLEVPGNGEATARLLRARVRSLEEQLQAAVDSAAAKDAALVEAQRELRAQEQERAAAAKAQKALQAQVERSKRAAQAAREAQAAQEAALKEREREEAKAHSGRKLAEQEARAREVRLARALEEVERHKALLQEERDGRDASKSDTQRLAGDNARLERQKNSLLAAFRKQLRLIDVLRRQKAHLEAARCLAFTEEEFMRALEAGQ
ncbi:MAG: hypothetical protein J3K34DRAFT_42954 [Monoraphidium minutum]|nr:MAG: hypothetical protein J3K34DRAFT_42954 [Monoraphidium minutum]